MILLTIMGGFACLDYQGIQVNEVRCLLVVFYFLMTTLCTKQKKPTRTIIFDDANSGAIEIVQ